LNGERGADVYYFEEKGDFTVTDSQVRWHQGNLLNVAD